MFPFLNVFLFGLNEFFFLFVYAAEVLFCLCSVCCLVRSVNIEDVLISILKKERIMFEFFYFDLFVFCFCTCFLFRLLLRMFLVLV
jgi:hypothetical protein